MADGDDAAISIPVSLITGDRFASNAPAKGQGRRRSRAVGLLLRLANLGALGSIDAMEADFGASDLDCVAVDDLGWPADLGRR